MFGRTATLRCLELSMLTAVFLFPDIKLTTWLQHTVQVQACGAAEAVSAYVPGPVSVGPEIYAGALAGVIPFSIGSWEFGKRIVRSLLHPRLCH